MPTKLGQNFLKDLSVVEKIISAADLSHDDTVIEIGPGRGVLTRELLKHAGKVVALELDHALFVSLGKSFADSKRLDLVEGDILKINLPELLESKVESRTPKVFEYRVVANIPYYITSAIIRLFLETKYPPKEMTIMIQKEVAERITAKSGAMSILAVSVQYYADAEILFDVPRSAFLPAPDVDSAVIRIRNKDRETNDKEDVRHFFRIVRSGFCARRKTLANNLANSLRIDKKLAEESVISLGFTPSTRAQELSIDDWKKLADLLR